MTNNKLQKIAVIGTGIMGMPVASNLAKSGHKIFIYARRPKSIKKKLHRNMALCNNKEQLFKSSNIFRFPKYTDIFSNLKSSFSFLKFLILNFLIIAIINIYQQYLLYLYY